MQLRFPIFASCTLLWLASLSAQIPVTDTWKYRLQKPVAQNWMQLGFKDDQWQTGNGGFGTRDTPGARIGTVWQSSDIWLRKAFEVTTIPARPALLIHHDEDAEIYLNGELVASLKRWTTDYQIIPLTTEHAQLLKPGSNVLAVHCHQETGGQFIDVHVIDLEKRPELPTPKRETVPFQSDLITQWGEAVTAANAWEEYPRPQLQRDQWRNLNGMWSYAITGRTQTTEPVEWDGEILVPFCLESKLGGVQRLLLDTEALWYRRSFDVSADSKLRTLLNFEAVDYLCDVFVNGKKVGSHQGGNTPFSFDITDAIKSGKNELVVRVTDETEGWQLRGKQTSNPRGIWYTQVSGIWQTVWLEQVASSFIEDVKIETDAAAGTITVVPQISGTRDGKTIRVRVKEADRTIAEAQGNQEAFTLSIPQPKRWSPQSPYLYDLEFALIDTDAMVLDKVKSYAGIRSLGKTRDAQGHLRFTLNGEVIFHWGPLDQGWWPDGLLTPPSDQAMLWDIEFLKESGFNMIRKHIKVEPRRYYYHCDRLGMMVWQDQVSGGQNPPWTRLKIEPEDALWDAAPHEQFMREFEEMIDALENHPSIVVWTPFNEAWGQHRTVEVGKWTVERDPSRHVNIASGGNFWPVGDIVDHHQYPHPDFPFEENRYRDFIKVVGEFGGHGYAVQGHVWDADRRNWGYGGLPKNEAEYKERYVQSIQKLNELRLQGIAAGVYTQTTDVEGEVNGLVTYDRKVTKIDPQELAKLHRILFE